MKLLLPLILLLCSTVCQAQDSTSQDEPAKLQPRAIAIDEEGLEENAHDSEQNDDNSVVTAGSDTEPINIQSDFSEIQTDLSNGYIVSPYGGDSFQSIFSLESIMMVDTNAMFHLYTQPTIISPLHREETYSTPYGTTRDLAQMEENKEILRELEKDFRAQEQDEPFPWALLLRVATGLLIAAFLILFGIKRMRGK